ncbi:hypothetical protein ACHAPT_000161 [Fusarium lateritium]
MSAFNKRKWASPEKLQNHLDDLVRSGAIVLGYGKRLKIDNDGLPQVTNSAEGPSPAPDCGARERLSNVIAYLESNKAPLAVSWRDALIKLHQLLQNNTEPNDKLDIRAWEICQAAHEGATNDIYYLDVLYDRFQADYTGHDLWTGRFEIIEFPQRACRLLGVRSSDSYSEQAWDDELADKIFEQDLETYRLIHRCFSHLMECHRGGLPYVYDLDGTEAMKYVLLLRELEPMKAVEVIMETEHFVILERKATIAKRDHKARQAKPATQAKPVKTPVKIKVPEDSD